MYGINDRPLIDLDDHIDVAAFAALKDELDLGIVKSQWDSVVFGVGIYDKAPDKDLYNLSVDLRNGARPDAQVVNAALASLPSRTQRRLYLKIRYGLYSSLYSVYLRRPKDDDYASINKSERCEWTGDEKHFPKLMKWIEALPLREVGRVIFFINEHLCPLNAHSDMKGSRQGKAYVAKHPHEFEFIWVRPTIEEGRSLYVLDEASGTKHYVRGHSCWFNSYDVHGSDASPVMTYTLRVDGAFTDDFKRRIGLR